jgi:hypothetical protein
MAKSENDSQQCPTDTGEKSPALVDRGRIRVFSAAALRAKSVAYNGLRSIEADRKLTIELGLAFFTGIGCF